MCAEQSTKIENRSRPGKAISFILLAIIPCMSLRADDSFDRQQQGCRSMALGGAGVALKGDAWALFQNPALITAAPNGGGAWYSPAPFGLSELATGSACFVWQPGATSVGGYASVSGFALYRETSAGVVVAGVLADRIRVGITSSWSNLAVRGYGNDGFLAIDAGAAAELGVGVTIGACITNANQPRLGESIRERLPLAVTVGASLDPGEGLTVIADLRGELRAPVDFRAGIEYTPLRFLALRAGTSTETGLFTCGVGVSIAGVAFDYAMSAHPDLGLTHAVSASILVAPRGNT
jgi:hypothetical protein